MKFSRADHSIHINIIWKPDVDLLTCSDMRQNCGQTQLKTLTEKKKTHDNICLHVVYPEDWEEHSDFDKILLDADMVGGGFLVLFRILSEILDWLQDEPWSDGAVFTIWPVLKATANATKNLIISQTLGLNCGSWPERGIRLLIDPALTFSWQN